MHNYVWGYTEILSGEPQAVQFSLRLVLSELRFMNLSENLLTLTHWSKLS